VRQRLSVRIGSPLEDPSIACEQALVFTICRTLRGLRLNHFAGSPVPNVQASETDETTEDDTYERYGEHRLSVVSSIAE
jgi:hypothetical protein